VILGSIGVKKRGRSLKELKRRRSGEKTDSFEDPPHASSRLLLEKKRNAEGREKSIHNEQHQPLSNKG